MRALKAHVLVMILVITILLASGCSYFNSLDERDYRQDMRDFVQGISTYANDTNPDFIIIAQNGHELLTENGESTGELAAAYLDSIDGVGREDLFYGYDADNVATPKFYQNDMVSFMDVAKSNGLIVLVTDYCSKPAYMDDSYEKNAALGYISFAANDRDRELNNIPEYPEQPFNMNSDDITSLAEARNFLYLINPDLNLDKQDFLSSIADTNYDLIIVDAFYDERALSERDVAALKVKDNGAKRLVIAYMSIGEAEDYRYYWQNDWKRNPPSWMAEENPNWDGNYKVRYWEPQWQGIIYGIGNDSANDGGIDNDIGGSYLKRILNAGFDGVYLDIIDAFEYFEDQRDEAVQ